MSSLYNLSALTNGATYYCILEAEFNTDVKSVSIVTPGTPDTRMYAFSTPKTITTQAPSIVIATQRILDRRTGKPVTGLLTYPDGSAKPVEDVFDILQDGSTISASESFLDSEPLGNIPTTIKTVLMLDISSSISITDLALELNAALNVVRKPLTDINGQPQLDTDGKPIYVSNLFPGQQISIYAFDEQIQLAQDFTSDHAVLAQAIMNIDTTARVNSTNLYGAIIDGFTPLENHFSIDSVTYSYMLLITDGDDTAGQKTLAQAIAAKGELDLFVIAVGNDIDNDVLTQLVLGEEIPLIDFPLSLEKTLAAAPLLFSIDNFSLLDDKLKQVATNASSFGDGIYLLYYATPARSGVHNVSISIRDNLETCSDSWIDFAGDCLVELSGDFPATGFSGVTPELVVNTESILEAGKTYAFTAKTRWTNDIPNYSWDYDNSTGDVIFSESGEGDSILTVEVLPYALHTSGTIGVIDNNTTALFTGEITANTLTENFQYVAGQGLFIEGVSQFNGIELNAVKTETSLKAVLIPSVESPVYQWTVSDPSLVELSIIGNDEVSIKRIGSTSGSATLSLSEASSGKIETFDINISFGLQDVTNINSGLGNNSCVIDSGHVLCWGSDTTGINTVPSDINLPESISVGAKNACVIDDIGLQCWGSQLTGINSIPQMTDKPSDVSVGVANACALNLDGVDCWGSSTTGINNVPTSLQNPYLISVANLHACAATDSGVVCWGGDTNLNGTVDSSAAVTELTTGLKFTCVNAAGSVACYGYNSEGQLNVPTGLSTPFALTSGYSHSCVADLNGVYCWGSNSSGQTDIPPSVINPLLLSAGQNHSCATTLDTVECWGGNSLNQTVTPE